MHGEKYVKKEKVKLEQHRTQQVRKANALMKMPQKCK